MESAGLRAAGLIGPHNQILALRIHAEVAVDHLRHEHPRGFCCGKLFPQNRANPILELFIGFGSSINGFGSELPLITKQRSFVDVGSDLIDSDPFDNFGAEEGRTVDRVVGSDLRGARGDGGIGSRPFTGAFRQGTPSRHPAKFGVPLAGAFHLHQFIQSGKALKRVFAVEHPTRVDLAEILLYVTPGERCTTEENRQFVHS